MELWDAFNQVCAHLRQGLLGGPPVEQPSSSWAHVVEVSSLFHVLPAVAYCVAKRTDLSTEVASYFESVHFLNNRRNRAILDTLEHTIQELQKGGIDPILLKGVSLLVEDLYPPGTRLVGDADMLISEDEADHAVSILTERDYAVSSVLLPEGHRHLPVLIHRGSGLAVELHTRLEQVSKDPVLPLAWFRSGCRQVPFRGLLARLPDPTRLVAMNFVHHRVNDMGRPSPVELRWLLDVALLRLRYESAIDWAALDEMAADKGHADTFATYIRFGEWLFDQAAPSTRGRPLEGAMKQLREYVDPWEREPPADAGIMAYSFDGREAVHVEGNCWRLSLSPEFLEGDAQPTTRTSSLELFEEGQKLGPAFASLQIIATKGKGAFAHHDRDLLFSASDNTDLRTANRRYVAKGWAASSATRRLASSRAKQIETLSERLSRTETALQEAQSLAAYQAKEVDALSESLSRTETALQEARSFAAYQTKELDGLSERLSVTHAALMQAQGLASERAEELKRVYGSASWRSTRLLRRLKAVYRAASRRSTELLIRLLRSPNRLG